MDQPERATGPLAGIRVIDVTTVVLGPYATQTLGDLGADSSRSKRKTAIAPAIRPGRGKGMAAYFATLNRQQAQCRADLKKPAARQALLRLVETADVFVHNMRDWRGKTAGLDYASLAACNEPASVRLGLWLSQGQQRAR